MRGVGVAIQLDIRWFYRSIVLYIALDNTECVCGDDLCAFQYTDMLRDNLNITLIYHVPRSPYCNDLDLGV